MIVRLTERDVGPLPRVRDRNAPDGPQYAQPAVGDRTGARADARQQRGRRRADTFTDAPVTRTTYPLTSIASLLPSSSDTNPPGPQYPR
jgi:hypothetical protein